MRTLCVFLRKQTHPDGFTSEQPTTLCGGGNENQSTPRAVYTTKLRLTLRVILVMKMVVNVSGERAEHATPGTLSTIVDHTSSSRMNHQAFFTREVQPHKHLKDASTRASTSGSNQRKSTCENTHAELAVASQPSLKRVRRSASAATNTRQSRIIQANGEGVVQLPVEVSNFLISNLRSFPAYNDLGDCDHKCSHCGAVFWLCRGCNRKGASEASDLDAKTKQEGDQQALGMEPFLTRKPCNYAGNSVVVN
ncbi:hypothetical protein Tco_0778494 [Tanacetum coccineum]